MPELPDIEAYLEALRPRIVDQVLEKARIGSPFLLRTVDPPLDSLSGKRVERLSRLGKRIVIEFEGELFLVVHLMIAGRFQWKTAKAAVPRRLGVAAFDFPGGTLLLTEAGTTRRASLHLVRGEAALRQFERGGLEPLEATPEAFADRLTLENHTLKRALTDPRLFSGIGNAYSDEILHRARLSPVMLTGRLPLPDIERLYRATQSVLTEWRQRLVAEARIAFPGKVTAFREGMAVHGRYGLPCPDCGAPVQRIRYATNETNYCARCQTGGKLLADRGLSRLLKGDWPKTLEELEESSSPLPIPAPRFTIHP